MEKQRLTPLEAWDQFYKNYKCEGPIPNELVVAQATRNGNQKNKNGKAKRLGVDRIVRLIKQYAPGEYQFHEAHFTKE